MDKTARKSKTMPILIGLGFVFYVIGNWLGIGTRALVKAFFTIPSGDARLSFNMTGSLQRNAYSKGMLPEREMSVVFKSEGAYRSSASSACLVTRSLSIRKVIFRERSENGH